MRQGANEVLLLGSFSSSFFFQALQIVVVTVVATSTQIVIAFVVKVPRYEGLQPYTTMQTK